VRRRLLVLGLLGLAALAAAGVATWRPPAPSTASYTTGSQTDVIASVDGASDWLHLYSQGTDPDGATGYARRRGLNGVWGGPAASGQDEGIVVDMGDFPDKKITVDFPLTFSLETPDVFPDPAVTQITVDLSVLRDPASGERILIDESLTPFGQTTGEVQRVTLGPGQKYQLNVSVRIRKRFVLGQSYYPAAALDLTVAGISGYYRYQVPLKITDAGGS
jgi:hypothetical protein